MKILVVEDDDLYRNIIYKVLCKDGHEVETFANGNEALEAIKNGIFDVLVTDMVLPGTEGIELVAEIKQSRPEVRVVAISGSGWVGHSTYLAVAQAHGADALLEKPFTADQLLAEISAGSTDA